MRLATKYRPLRFGEVSGQRAVRAVLHGMASSRKVPAAMLFYGAYGSGKTTCARIFAAALNCEGPPGRSDVWPCGACPSCKAVANSTSLDVIEVDAASNGTVERVKEICDLCQYGTTGSWRVVILDEAHSMSRDAANHLLKTAEEPPPNTVFVFVTTEKNKLIATIPSRCSPFAFTRLPVDVIARRLLSVRDAEGLNTSDELVYHLADQANGAMRDGLMLLEQAGVVGIPDLYSWQQLTCQEDFAPLLLLAAATGDKAAMYAELDRALLVISDYASLAGALASCLRDVLVLQSGAPVAAQGDRLARRERLAAETRTWNVVQAMRVLWNLQVKVSAADRPGSLELALTEVSERLCPTPKPADPTSNGNGHRVLSADELSHQLREFGI